MPLDPHIGWLVLLTAAFLVKLSSCFRASHMFQILPSTSSFTASVSPLLSPFLVIAPHQALGDFYFLYQTKGFCLLCFHSHQGSRRRSHTTSGTRCAGVEPSASQVSGSYSETEIFMLPHRFNLIECKSSMRGISLSTTC